MGVMRDLTCRNYLLAVGAVFLVLILALHADKLNQIEEKVNVRNHLASGKANYLPGAACVIATSGEQTPADIINYARACAKAHESWLQTNTHEQEGVRHE